MTAGKIIEGNAELSIAMSAVIKHDLPENPPSKPPLSLQSSQIAMSDYQILPRKTKDSNDCWFYPHLSISSKTSVVPLYSSVEIPIANSEHPKKNIFGSITPEPIINHHLSATLYL